MIIKQRDERDAGAADSGDARLQAGRQAEEQMAFYLRRAFGERKDIYVFNDLRLIRVVDSVEDVGQIDHLVMHRAGLVIVESKAVHDRVRVNERGEWSRTYNGRHQGMPSPIEQAKRQAKFLVNFLNDHAPEVAGKIFGLMQAHFGMLSVDVIVAVSDSGIIDRPQNLPLPEVCKADQVSARVVELLGQQRREVVSSFVSFDLNASRGRYLSRSEMENLVGFLPAQHRPIKASADRPAKFIPPPLVELFPLPREVSAIPPAMLDTLKAQKETCTVCNKPLTPKSAQYCRDNEKRFKGRLLCYEHQRAGRTNPASAQAAV